MTLLFGVSLDNVIFFSNISVFLVKTIPSINSGKNTKLRRLVKGIG